MDSFVLDASVALKWFFPKEKGSDLARKILKKAKRGELEVFVPQIFFFEVINVIKTKTKSTSNDVFQAIDKIFSLNLVSEEVNKPLLIRANFYAQKYDLTVYDASYLALAKILGVSLITADEKLAQRVKLKFVKPLKSYKIRKR